MLWMITKDLTNSGNGNVGICNDDLMFSLDSSTVPAVERAKVIADCDTEFRLIDDDGNAMYEGVCLGLDDASGDEAFEPMDRFGESEGVCGMQYRAKGAQTWKDL